MVHPMCSYIYTCVHLRKRDLYIDVCANMRTALLAAGRSGSAHTWSMLDTDAVFHAPIFALNAVAW